MQWTAYLKAILIRYQALKNQPMGQFHVGEQKFSDVWLHIQQFCQRVHVGDVVDLHLVAKIYFWAMYVHWFQKKLHLVSEIHNHFTNSIFNVNV